MSDSGRTGPEVLPGLPVFLASMKILKSHLEETVVAIIRERTQENRK